MSGRPRITIGPLGRPGRGATARERLAVWRQAFRAWRRTRPFWGGLWCVLGGLVIAYFPLTAIRVILISGTNVVLGIVVGLLVVMMGLFLWFTPHLRQLVGLLAVVFSIVSLITSDYGGLAVGMILGIVGGGLGFAWTPVRAAKAR